MRRMNRPPLLRAHRWQKKAVRAFPRCKEPVGLGAKRVMTGDESKVADISQDCTYSSRISNMKQLLLALGLISSLCPTLNFAAEAPPAAAATPAPSPAASPAPSASEGAAAAPAAAAKAQSKTAAPGATATPAAAPQ